MCLVLVDVSLNVAASDDLQRSLQDYVARIGGLVNPEHGRVSRSRLAVVHQFKLHAVSAGVVEIAPIDMLTVF